MLSVRVRPPFVWRLVCVTPCALSLGHGVPLVSVTPLQSVLEHPVAVHARCVCVNIATAALLLPQRSYIHHHAIAHRGGIVRVYTYAYSRHHPRALRIL